MVCTVSLDRAYLGSPGKQQVMAISTCEAVRSFETGFCDGFIYANWGSYAGFSDWLLNN